jgi:hypothetical protein
MNSSGTTLCVGVLVPGGEDDEYSVRDKEVVLRLGVRGLEPFSVIPFSPMMFVFQLTNNYLC